MIPRAHITDWRSQAPWPTDAQVEQDLVLTRALTEIFIRSAVANAVAFRGGTALHKLYLERPGRYSEDIDLVQIEAGPIGNVLDAEKLNNDSIIKCFQRYLAHGELTVTRAQFEENLTDKMQDDAFLEDVEPLLPTGITYRAETAYNLVSSRLIARLPGDPWKGSVP